ncbi:GNAT family N-acetyltransferase [Chthonobacter albigriseus]|uniref:GNAT family N-acetyltransferase n=1 Tax=Chthonobacter albigriseus TaxID=1683161 RepID=UPI0015EEC201|nr:GNAT family N-acetyltransferase [Chthonobacter albigriseus]
MTVDVARQVSIRRLTPEEVRNRAHELADMLIDAVDAGAQVSLMRPLAPLSAVRFVLDVADAMKRSTHLFIAEDAEGIVGAAQLVRASAANQPHRASVDRLLVHRRGRGRGVGQELMQELETSARVMGITLLTADAAPGGPGERLYRRVGFLEAGTIPGYALDPDGAPTDAVIYYKPLH